MNSRMLRGKTILMLAPFFFGYENKIRDKLVEYGANVTLCNDDPSNFYSTVIETFWHYKISDKYLIALFERSVYGKIKKKKYDYVLVVNGWAISENLVKRIRESLLNSNGKMILYYWDSMNVLNDDMNRLKYFDRILTFDNVDYYKYKERYNMEFLPLFYCDEYDIAEQKIDKCQYDLATIGSFKYNRYNLIQELKQNNLTISIKDVLFATRIVYFHKLLRKKYANIDIDRFVYKKLAAQDIINIYKECFAVLDIPISGQNGLTMRTFECLGMKKKIVTTNKNVALYDFYDPQNIFILTDINKLPSKDWFSKESNWDNQVIRKYSINTWLNVLFGFQKYSYLLEDKKDE